MDPASVLPKKLSAAEEEELRRAQASFTNDSAFMIAHERALETERTDGSALFRDPWARQLAGTKGAELSKEFGVNAAPAFGLWTEFHEVWTAVRTTFIDEHVTAALAAPSPPQQLVNLGAGLDTRAYRLPAAAKLQRAFAVDMDVINTPRAAIFSALHMKPLCPEVAVSVDLSEAGALSDKLQEAGFDKAQPSIFLAEGLIMYLTVAAGRELLAELGRLAAVGSLLLLNYMDAPQVLDRAQVDEALEAAGWKRRQHHRFGEPALDYGRYQHDYPPSGAFSFVVAHQCAAE
jgi:methyltransferase (TIGR00027 family)